LLTNTHGYDDNGNLIDRQNQTAADLPDHSEFFYDGYDRRERRVDRGGAEPDITTHYEYIANGPSESMDVVREYVEQGGGTPASDIRRDIDELGRPWQERIVKTPPTTNDNADRITTTTFDITGNEVATRVADTAFGDALVTREFTCFDYPDSMTQRLSDAPLTEAFTDYQTDGRGNVTVIDDPVGNRTQHDFDALDLRWRSRFYEGTAALQLRSETTYTSREQKATEIRYNGAGAALDQQRWGYDALGFQTRWARMADPTSPGPIQVNTDRVIDTINDGVGRVLSRTGYDNGAPRTTQWDYDDIGRLLTITHPVGGNTDTLAYYANSTRPETRTINDQIGSRALRTAFDPFGRLKTQIWQGSLPDITTGYTYDATGRRVTTTDPKGYVTREQYDGIGQRTQFIEDFGGANQRSVTFAYTQKGDLETVTANDGEGPQVTSYQYDLAGRRKRITHPDSSFIAFTYDDAGRIETRTTEDNFVTWYERNWRGQALEKRQNGPAGTLLEEFGYDPLSRMTLASVGPQATSAYKDTWTYGDGVNGPAFVDEPLSESQAVNGVTKTVAFEYSTAGERTLLEYPAGCNESLAYTRDGFGQVTAIDRNGNRLANYTYAGRFPRFRQVRTRETSQEVWIELNWSRPDQLRRPAAISNQVRTGSSGGQGGLLAFSHGFTNQFDPASNLDSQTVANRPAENGLHAFGYDRLHRVTDIDYPDATNEAWQIDDLSNWETYTSRDTSVTTYADNVLNQYTSISGGATTPLHNSKGNLVRSERGYGFTYDFENRLTRVFTDSDLDGQYDVGEPVHAEYVVDPLGRRVMATVSGQTTYRYYDGPVVLAEFAATTPTTPTACYFNGPNYLDEKLLIKRAAGAGGSTEYYYLLKDLYTVSGIVSQNGQLVEWYTYDGYGRPTTHAVTGAPCNGCGHAPTCAGDVDGDNDIDLSDLGSLLAAYGSTVGQPSYNGCADFDCDGTIGLSDLGALLANYGGVCPSPGNPFRFTGQRVDELDVGALLLYDYKARVYDPRHGRFLQRDPGEFADSHNPYEYALSRPTVATDPTGEFTIVGISVSTAISRGLSALNAADAARRVLNVARRLRAGVDVRTILIDVVIDVASDRLGGKLFDKAAAALNQVGKLVRKGFDRHHPIPIALGGNVDQFLNPLSTSVHRSNFAKALNEELEKRGIDLKATGGPGNSAKEWAELLENGGPGVQADVLESVLAESKRMDDQFGTNLTESVWLNILTGHFKAVE
jgi:RHS repeat-associated protein